MPRKQTQEEVIREFRVAHGTRYDYSKVVYEGSATKVIVVCERHGPFAVTPSHHKAGVGCRACAFESSKISRDEFIARARELHGERYEYRDVPSDLRVSSDSIEITCRVHGVLFRQSASTHMHGHTGCPECKSLLQTGPAHLRGSHKARSEVTDDFVSRARLVHEDRYNYDECDYRNAYKKVRIRCGDHGVFEQAPGNHLRGSGCPSCATAEKFKDSFKNRCAALGIDYWRALKRREAGMSDERIFSEALLRSEKETTPVTVYGVRYPNLEAAVRALEPMASSTTIERWLKKGTTPEVAFERVPNPGCAEGSVYLIEHLASGKRYVGLTVQTIERRWQFHLDQAASNRVASMLSLHSAIRLFGVNAFTIRKIDSGVAKRDLEQKERDWIARLNAMAPNGFNLNRGGVSGGSDKKPITVDGIFFPGVQDAALYVSQTRGITVIAAKKRISVGRIDVKAHAPKGKSLVKTPAYKAWSSIIHGRLNPRAKDYTPGIDMHTPWRDASTFIQDVGQPTENGMVFARLDKSRGFFPDNCRWMTKSEASRLAAVRQNSRK